MSEDNIKSEIVSDEKDGEVTTNEETVSTTIVQTSVTVKKEVLITSNESTENPKTDQSQQQQQDVPLLLDLLKGHTDIGNWVEIVSNNQEEPTSTMESFRSRPSSVDIDYKGPYYILATNLSVDSMHGNEYANIAVYRFFGGHRYLYAVHLYQSKSFTDTQRPCMLMAKNFESCVHILQMDGRKHNGESVRLEYVIPGTDPPKTHHFTHAQLDTQLLRYRDIHPAEVKQKSDPFGAAKPIDTAGKLQSIEKKLREESEAEIRERGRIAEKGKEEQQQQQETRQPVDKCDQQQEEVQRPPRHHQQQMQPIIKLHGHRQFVSSASKKFNPERPDRGNMMMDHYHRRGGEGGAVDYRRDGRDTKYQHQRQQNQNPPPQRQISSTASDKSIPASERSDRDNHHRRGGEGEPVVDHRRDSKYKHQKPPHQPQISSVPSDKSIPASERSSAAAIRSKVDYQHRRPRGSIDHRDRGGEAENGGGHGKEEQQKRRQAADEHQEGQRQQRQQQQIQDILKGPQQRRVYSSNSEKSNNVSERSDRDSHHRRGGGGERGSVDHRDTKYQYKKQHHKFPHPQISSTASDKSILETERSDRAAKVDHHRRGRGSIDNHRDPEDAKNGGGKEEQQESRQAADEHQEGLRQQKLPPQPQLQSSTSEQSNTVSDERSDKDHHQRQGGAEEGGAVVDHRDTNKYKNQESEMREDGQNTNKKSKGKKNNSKKTKKNSGAMISGGNRFNVLSNQSMDTPEV